MTDPMVQLIREYRLIPPGSAVLCAVSGGADSIYLLHRLWRLRRELNFTLAAAHFDHRLRGAESAQDMEFVRDMFHRTFGDFSNMTVYISSDLEKTEIESLVKKYIASLSGEYNVEKNMRTDSHELEMLIYRSRTGCTDHGYAWHCRRKRPAVFSDGKYGTG